MSDSYRIRVSPAALRQLGRLPPRIAAAVVEFITVILADNPLRSSKPSTGEFAERRSARRGDHRVTAATGEGLGATHQTGWTALVAHLLNPRLPPDPR